MDHKSSFNKILKYMNHFLLEAWLYTIISPIFLNELFLSFNEAFAGISSSIRF